MNESYDRYFNLCSTKQFNWSHFSSVSSAVDDSPILEPLHFETSDREVFIASSGELSCPCVLCNEEFSLPKDKDVMLKHFVTVHKLVIADVALIADLGR